MQRLKVTAVGLAIALFWAGVSVFSSWSSARADGHTVAASNEVCEIVTTMPDAADTDAFLALLETDRAQVISDLTAMKRNMERYNTEGYGWQNVIDSPSGSEPQPGAWLLGALKMSCENAAASFET